MDDTSVRGTAPVPEPGQLHAVLVVAASTGGIGAHVRSLAQGLVAHGLTVTVCGPAATDQQFGFSATGARFHPVEITPSSGPRADAAAIGELRRAFTGAGVVHAHGLRAGLLSDLALRTAGRVPGMRPQTPLVVTMHHALLGTGMERRLLRLMERRVARAADLLLGASSDLVARARELGAGDARLGPVAAPPLPAATLDRAAARAALPGASDRPVVLAVGRLAAQKGFDLLLDASRLLAGLDPRPLVVIAGEGPEGGALRDRVAAERLPVLLLGHRTDVPELLAAADLVVISSRWEARPLVAQEALRAGVPLVATAVGGVPELVGDAAVLVPYGDAAALGRAVAGLLADAPCRARLAEQGRAQALTWPDEVATVAQVLSIYDELVQRS
ncbi:glycosyltransferase family 4 protein [Streptomyces sp. NPDC092296]|uniref:glycosyltransferase family 4 protein n=1 Tax=Streptomyces sp. NPDC092296 TaxID=3366012 RepID=UPI003812AFBC